MKITCVGEVLAKLFVFNVVCTLMIRRTLKSVDFLVRDFQVSEFKGMYDIFSDMIRFKKEYCRRCFSNNMFGDLTDGPCHCRCL